MLNTGSDQQQITAHPRGADAHAIDRPGPQAMGPPHPRFVVTVGVTGHRMNRLTGERAAVARLRVDAALADIADVSSAIWARAGHWFAPEPPEFRFISALAEGADRISAEMALERGFILDAALPFPASVYADDFPDPRSREAFKTLLARAQTVLELPGDRAAESAAYSLAGGAILAASDILIAVWNGEGSGGRGGTGDVVASALAMGKPVVHIPIDEEGKVRLLWPGEGPAGGSWHSALEPPAEPFDKPHLDEALRTVLLPPDEPGELQALKSFMAETEKLQIRRIEYPLLLAATGAQKLGKGAWRKQPYLPATRSDWQRFDAAVAGRIAPMRFARLEEGFAWADNLANRFAQFFRSGHVMNFTFSAIAVALALFGYLFGGSVKTMFVAIELLLIAAIVGNTRMGRAGSWQQRWLDYRQLAERLRPMRSLKLLAVARPPAVSASSRTGSRRWVDWYAAAIWRQMGMPGGTIDAAELERLVGLVRNEEMGPEIGYHRRNAHRMAHVNHRLHQFGSACFIATVLLCIAFLATTAILDSETANQAALLFTVATATLPAFGTAAYGLRVQGDFAGSAARSAATADALADMAGELETHPTLARTAAIANAAAAIMLVDLAEWRLTYEQRSLEIPG